MFKTVLRKLIPNQLLTIALSFFLFSFSIRTVLLIQELVKKGTELKFAPIIYLQGFLHDLHIFIYLAALYFVFSFIFGRLYTYRFTRFIPYLFNFALTVFFTFVTFSEWFFWDEFSSRFNFIAVDYLIYTNEVIGNIRESYNMPLLLTSVALISLAPFALFTFLTRKRVTEDLNWRTKGLCSLSLIGLLVLLAITPYVRYSSGNFITDQLSLNGPKEFVTAFLHNRIDFKVFYKTIPHEEMLGIMEQEFKTDGTEIVKEPSGRLVKKIKGQGAELKPNVVLIMVESLGANFLEYFGNKDKITPYLDSLIPESHFFANIYATGTRTVRGIEAVSLSLPPTPGQSAIRRPYSKELFNIGTVFRQKDYVTKFVYGGWGMFDNMNSFFGSNGFEIIDRAVLDNSEITFTTAWGVCDGDLLKRTIKEADQEFQKKNPFFLYVLTTSNHRPYAFPDKDLDLKSVVSGRNGAVKYTDYAIKKFIEEAKTKKWFDNTIFVIMADHSASGRGKVSIPVPTYHIPLWIYAPKLVKPRLVNSVASEIDVAPTLFGLLNWNYDSYFLGQDLLKTKIPERFFSGTYQAVGMYSSGHFTELGLKSFVADNTYDIATKTLTPIKDKDEAVMKKTIAYYQYADWLLNEGLYKEVKSVTPAKDKQNAQ